jgi:ATP-dependent helicase/nuclease subunit A
VHCFLERAGEVVSKTYEASDIERLEAEVAGLATGILAGDFAPTSEPHRDLCATCPGRPALCSHDETVTLRARPDPPSPGGSPHEGVRVSRSEPVQQRLF